MSWAPLGLGMVALLTLATGCQRHGGADEGRRGVDAATWFRTGLGGAADLTRTARANPEVRRRSTATGATDPGASGQRSESVEDQVWSWIEAGEITSAERVAQLADPASPSARRINALLDYARARSDAAYASLSAEHAASPGDLRLRVLLAEVAAWQHRPARAHELLAAVDPAHLRGGPRPWELMVHVARTRTWLGDREHAEALFSEVLAMPALPPRFSVLARVRLAELLAWRRDFAAARPLLEEALAQRPGDVDASLVKGQMEEWQGKFRQARRTYSAALQAHPTDESLRWRLQQLAWVR